MRYTPGNPQECILPYRRLQYTPALHPHHPLGINRGMDIDDLPEWEPARLSVVDGLGPPVVGWYAARHGGRRRILRWQSLRRAYLMVAVPMATTRRYAAPH